MIEITEDAYAKILEIGKHADEQAAYIAELTSDEARIALQRRAERADDAEHMAYELNAALIDLVGDDLSEKTQQAREALIAFAHYGRNYPPASA